MGEADNEQADELFTQVLGPDYWVPTAGISRERIRQIEASGVKALLAAESAMKTTALRDESQTMPHSRRAKHNIVLNRARTSSQTDGYFQLFESCRRRPIAKPAARPPTSRQTFEQLRTKVLALISGSIGPS